MDSLKVYFTCSSDESDTDQLKDENRSDSCDIGCYQSDTSLSCVAESMDGEPLENEPDEGSQNFEEKSVNTKEKPISEAREAPYDTLDRGCSMSDGETEHELNGSIQARETVYNTSATCVTPKEKPLTSDAPDRPTTPNRASIDSQSSSESDDDEHERKKPKRGAAYMMPLKDLPHSIRSLLKNVRRFWTKPHKLERVTAPLMLTTWSKVEERLLCK